MSDRLTRLQTFIEAEGWGRAETFALPGDASFRRYIRLLDGTRRALLMDAPPPEDPVRFAAIARHLVGLGYSAPAILAEEPEAGLLLLEDLGDQTFTRLLDQGADPFDLYALATDVLIDLHRCPRQQAALADLPLYDHDRLIAEACLLPDWYMPQVLGRPTPAAVRDAYVEAWRNILPLADSKEPTLVLRDYHVDNLMRLSDRSGLAACGLLDFQDAVIGPPAYDLMSLLEDARREVAEPLRIAMLARYRRAMPALDWDAFLVAFAVLAATRHAKVIGIFTRLSVRDGKPRYLRHIPRVWRLLERALVHPALASVRDWFDHQLPANLRESSQCLTVAP
ncbi:MAG: aminoglycoside phosphotransferase [Rhodospirillales bacterium]|nr:MAG: aminoglycoside phosphotransferase [Rhodospirillales bacterium]